MVELVWKDEWLHPRRDHSSGKKRDAICRLRIKEKYVPFKYRTALLLQPKKIVEIGVQCGYAARAFLEACPEAEYIGFDISGRDHGFIKWSRRLLRPFNARIYCGYDTQKSQDLELSDVDLFHVDGSHKAGHCYHDMVLAAKTLRPGGAMLVDDAEKRKPKRPATPGFMKWVDEFKPQSVARGGAHTGDMLVIP